MSQTFVREVLKELLTPNRTHSIEKARAAGIAYSVTKVLSAVALLDAV
jgi:hypothetical protein